MGVLSRWSARPALRLVARRGFFHTHTWIRFTRWQDPVAEKKLFEGYDEAAKIHTDPRFGVYVQMEDPSNAIRKPYVDRTREEVS